MSSQSLLAGRYAPFVGINSKEIVTWCEISKLIGENSLFIDRTGAIESPLRMVVAANCGLPSLDRKFSKSYEEICDERVTELLRLQDAQSATGFKPLCLLYSGGIDSTLMLVSFLKRLSKKDLRERTILYLNPTSISENQKFYREHLRSHFRMETSEKSLDRLSGNNIVLGAEFNDHLFGNYLNQILALYYGGGYFEMKYSKDSVALIFQTMGMSEDGVAFWVEALDFARSRQNLAEIATLADFFWWFNFNYRWQASYFSMVLRMPVRYRSKVSFDFLNSNFQHFFMTDDFQRWSMRNRDKKIKSTWESYKWPAKDIIYGFNRDETYRDHKIKAPSLNYILMQKTTASALTSDYKFLDRLNGEDWCRR